MSEFVLVLRGSMEQWNALSKETRQELIQKHVAWSQKLRTENRLRGGAGLSGVSKKLVPENGRVSVVDGPYVETKEALTGYYLIEARDFDEALAIAHECPALGHGESVEVLEVEI